MAFDSTGPYVDPAVTGTNLNDTSYDGYFLLPFYIGASATKVALKESDADELNDDPVPPQMGTTTRAQSILGKTYSFCGESTPPWGLADLMAELLDAKINTARASAFAENFAGARIYATQSTVSGAISVGDNVVVKCNPVPREQSTMLTHSRRIKVANQGDVTNRW